MAAQYAYDFSMYNSGSTAPVSNPQRKAKPEPSKAPELKALKRRHEDERIKELANAKAVAKFSALVVFGIVIFSIICSSFAAVKSAQYKKLQYESQLNLQRNQYLEKCAELNALVTPEEIAKVAVQKLGMVKISDENKLYANANGENKIIVSMDKQ